MLASAAFGWLAMSRATTYFKEIPDNIAAWEVPILLTSLVPVIWIAILIHELGHLAGARAVGFRFLFLEAGPVSVHRMEGGLKFTWAKKLGFMGRVACYPADFDNINSRMIWYIAAGPVASLPFALLFWPVFLQLPALFQPPVALEILVSALIGVFAALPSRNRGQSSDGGKIRTLLQGGAAAEHMTAVILLTSQLMAGTRCRDLSPDLLARLSPVEEVDPYSAVTLMLRYGHALDSGDIPTGLALLDQLPRNLDCLSARQQACIYLDAALQEARHRNDAAQARAWLAKVPAKPSFVRERSRMLSEAAILRAEGNVEGSRSLASRALELESPVYAINETELLKELAT